MNPTHTELSDLCAVLLAGGWDIVYVLLSRRLMSGRDVVLVLVCFHCVVHINLSNTSRNYHLDKEAQKQERQVRNKKKYQQDL